MDDFLYIILGVAWVAWSIYSNKIKQDKKRAEKAEMERQAQQRRAAEIQNQTQTSRQPDYTVPTIEIPPVIAKPERSILEEIFGEEFTIQQEAEEEAYTPEIDERNWQKRINEYAKGENTSLEEITEEVSADYFEKKYSEEYKSEEQHVINKRSDDEVEFQLDELNEEFDLKKAIIYSEIIRAPYISA